MSAVVSLCTFREQRATAALVLVDVHQDLTAHGHELGSPNVQRALTNCRAALRHARAHQIPVAFTRQLAASSRSWASPNYPSWIEGLEPTRLDMVFDRELASCYSNDEFAEMIERIGGVYVIAGLFGDGACLSTAIDAFHRDHRMTFLADASLSRARTNYSVGAIHKAVSGMLSLYADVGETQPWIHATLRRVGTSG